MSYIKLEKPIVSVDWLNTNLLADTIVVLDATITKITASNLLKNENQIPNARFFDLKNKFSDTSAVFPTTFPSTEQFQEEARVLGINKDAAIVIYDDEGIYSSARAWWLFKAFGYDNVAVLDGGFPEWKQQNFKIEPKQVHLRRIGNFVAKNTQGLMCFFEDIKSITKDLEYQILDARSNDRFNAIVAEPRKGLRSGNIPNSINLPYQNLINNGKMKSKSELNLIFNDLNINDKKLVFSCGSGITACILALGAEIAGHKNIAVYDGSWTEYGSLIKA
ncbi:sulfurtransferase [Ichthyenterobacterium magnum]|uniref:Thiosulfate/3-mercaptopyruvate sulfurtransferase n=1 Tax=Ichthyenterobacterium magnum TaxID=1230530 RepID=A0A420DMA1_9FLAO|nr:sulfurtransferase [Ichthyenterobacterium magnum]RKE95414.1 thiosulfate/3-mercaptopyruvate sulfurtransferase [Ichthyenterobacterium magnum]